MNSEKSAFAHIKTLHHVVTQNYDSVDQLLKSYLKAGCKIFNLEVGIASQINNDLYTVLAVGKNPFCIEAGAVFELENTYCREVHSRQTTVHVHNAGATEPFRSHPAYESLSLESYISSPIFVHGRLYGTLNFSSTKERKTPFQDFEIELNEMMADSVGRFVEAKLEQDKNQHQLDRMYTMAKLSTLGEMAGGIAHEINNPLAIILASSSVAQSVVQSEFDTPPTLLVESLERIDNTVSRISKIVGGMKRLINDGKSEEMQANDFAVVVDTSMSFSVERIKSRGISLTTKVDESVMVNCNAGQISQILTNLLSNAVDAVQGTNNPWISVELQTQGSMVQLRVSDSGSGVTEDKKKNIFTPFYTTKDPGKGTGLGLSISSRIASNHGGRLYLDENSPNTCFVLELPDFMGSSKVAS